MENSSIKNLIKETLKTDERIWFTDDETNQTELNQTLLIDLVEKTDANIIDLLLQNETLREKFFVKMSTPSQCDTPPKEGNTYVFKTRDFVFFLEENKVDNSFTDYKNRIGLTDGKRFLKDTTDVVLDFPYKDCVLEGGQSNEDGTDTYFEYDEKVTKTEEKKGFKSETYNQKQTKRKEVFFNSVLAQDEIDRLFDKKALINWKKFDKNGEHSFNSPPLEGQGWGKRNTQNYMNLPYNPKLKERARALRKQGILSEVLFWNQVKNKQFLGLDFDRQKIIGNYIVDFYCASHNVVIEIDGSSHDDKQEYDAERDAFLEGLGLVVIHFTDSDVKNNIESVIESLQGHTVFKTTPTTKQSPSQSDINHPDCSAATPPKEGNLTPSLLRRGSDGTIKDNLIIKGNNLLALHSLKSEFAGKVKLIYIDPPYNTGNDGFKYNDNFNHSTWLTFMKNRLEVAKTLLRDDGVIFVQCDDNEQAYLKVLMDEVFGRENFVSCIAYRKTDNQSNIGNIARVKEYILLYSKTQNINLNKIPLSEKAQKEYRYSDENGKFRRDILLHKTRGRHTYDVITPSGKVLTGPWMATEEKFKKLVSENGIYWTNGGDEQPYGKIYLKNSKGQIASDWIDKEFGTNQQASVALEKLFGYRAFEFSKSVPLIKHLIHIGTNKDDIILDYHAGSGTTAHAVLELNKEDGGNRKFIMVEQMDYIQSVTCPRVQKVMERENIDDSLLYCELAEWNEKAKAEILEQKDFASLKSFFGELYKKYFLNYNLKTKEFVEKTIQEENFAKLTLDEQKAIFIAMLDNNQMYVNQSEIDDEKYGVSESDKVMSGEFYNLKEK